MSTNPNNWSSPVAAFNISPKDADVFLANLMIAGEIYAVQAQIKPVAINPGWPPAPPIPIEVRSNITANPNVGYKSLTPWFENTEQAFVSTPLQIEVMLNPPANLGVGTSQWVNLAQFIADWKYNQNATLLTTFPGINSGSYTAEIAAWVAMNNPAPPQPLPPI